MSKSKRILILVAILLLACGVAVWLLTRISATHSSAQNFSSAPLSPVRQRQPSPESKTITNGYQQLSLKTMSRDEAIKVYVARLRGDNKADWKMPIDFYGKVIDENNRPVAGAKIMWQWNTIDAASGTAYKDTTSDTNGLFSLTNQRGKILGVRVEKEGYYTVDGGQGAVSFEYATPASPMYYEPDSNHPVIFHLHTKGLNATRLLHWKRDVALNAKNQKALDLETGKTTEGQPHSLFIEVLTNNSRIGSIAWSARVSVIDGSLQTYTEQFPFTAPDGGYQSIIDLNLDTPKPSDMEGFQGAAFYVQTPKGYGRFEVRMLLGEHSIEVEGYFNPDPTSRSLEPASD